MQKKSLEKLKSIIKNTRLDNVFKSENIKSGGAKSIQDFHVRKGIFEFFGNHNLEQSKQEFHQCGLLELLNAEKNSFGFTGVHTFDISFPLLSDSEEMLKKYKSLLFQYNEDHISKGFSSIFSNTFLKFLASDYEGVFNNLEIIKTKVITKKSERHSIALYEYFSALLEKDKDKIITVINKLLSPQEHNYRNQHQGILREFVSQPTIGFTKLAWQQDIEIEIDSDYIPMELMPIKPNLSYEDEYLFLWNVEN